MSETKSPDDIATLLNSYLTEMVEIVFEHGGTLDKFIGDAIMALWGAPIAHEDDADRAMACALARLGPLHVAPAPSAALGLPVRVNGNAHVQAYKVDRAGRAVRAIHVTYAVAPRGMVR